MSEKTPLKVAYLTAGAAGMYCGSCLHDNTLAREMIRLGADVQLIPTYTPIRTDEQDVSVDRVFFGGVNVYLQQKLPWLRFLPSFLDRFLDNPRFLRWVTAKATEMDYGELGALTVSMLKGNHGRQRKEVQRLCKWLKSSVAPDILNLSNMLIAGCVPEIKRQLGKPVLATLQGDDIFLQELPEPYHTEALDEIYQLTHEIDGFITHSQYYADFMSDYFRIPQEKFHITPLGLDANAFPPQDPPAANRPPTIGYLARLAPEKGLHLLVDAFIELRRRPNMQEVRLHLAGWLGDHRREYVEEQFDKLKAAGLEDAYHYYGEVDHQGKHQFLLGLDALSTPTTYRDPKGLFILEAFACGVPVVQPNHGAFPEILQASGGGLLFEPGNVVELADCLQQLLTDQDTRQAMGEAGKQYVHQRVNGEAMAKMTLEVYRRFE